jgi:hypothetical protein
VSDGVKKSRERQLSEIFLFFENKHEKRAGQNQSHLFLIIIISLLNEREATNHHPPARIHNFFTYCHGMREKHSEGSGKVCNAKCQQMENRLEGMNPRVCDNICTHSRVCVCVCVCVWKFRYNERKCFASISIEL